MGYRKPMRAASINLNGARLARLGDKPRYGKLVPAMMRRDCRLRDFLRRRRTEESSRLRWSMGGRPAPGLPRSGSDDRRACQQFPQAAALRLSSFAASSCGMAIFRAGADERYPPPRNGSDPGREGRCLGLRYGRGCWPWIRDLLTLRSGISFGMVVMGRSVVEMAVLIASSTTLPTGGARDSLAIGGDIRADPLQVDILLVHYRWDRDTYAP